MDEAEALALEVAHARAARRPAWATAQGIPGHDGRLRAQTTEALVEELAEIETLLARARKLPPSLTRDALVHHLELERFEIAEV
ncbi:MAG TPA: hypothetical protein VHH36_02960, partial [Candidatus Thermoplasmatota archaeon]|nr:hypothetical protein [Candidatus Thermoplasmatota archaeon]